MRLDERPGFAGGFAGLCPGVRLSKPLHPASKIPDSSDLKEIILWESEQA